MAAADVAMYESKRRGKNRIVGYQTRMERVATAIDVEAGELIQLAPAPEARTGGDPAPWSRPAQSSRSRPWHRRHDADGPRPVRSAPDAHAAGRPTDRAPRRRRAASPQPSPTDRASSPG